jgi:hypothetical protein
MRLLLSEKIFQLISTESKCSKDLSSTLIILTKRLNKTIIRDKELSMICQNCSRAVQPSELYKSQEMIGADCCESLDCIIFYERCRTVKRLEDYSLSVEEIEN